jgi:hypothetical protein
MARLTPALAMMHALRAGQHPSFATHFGAKLSVSGIPPQPPPLPTISAPWKDLAKKALNEKDKIKSIGMNVLVSINIGPQRPVAHANILTQLGIQLKNEAMQMEVDMKALPLKFSDDWRKLRFFRMQSALPASVGSWRSSLASLGAPAGFRAQLPSVSMAATAQSEFFAFNGHADLWHMNWRARLSLSKSFVPMPPQLQSFWVH